MVGLDQYEISEGERWRYSVQREVEQIRFRSQEDMELGRPPNLSSVQGRIERTWWPISRQIYADVAKSGKPGRVDFFIGTMA